MGGAIEAWLVGALFVCLLGYGAINDIRTFTIPNSVSLGLIALFIAHVIVARPAISVSGHVLAAAIAFAVTFSFFLMGWFGAADVKLITALMLWAGPEHGGAFILVLSVIAWVLSVLLLVIRRVQRRRPNLFQNKPFSRVGAWARRGIYPFGLPIAAAGFWISPHLFGLL